MELQEITLKKHFYSLNVSLYDSHRQEDSCALTYHENSKLSSWTSRRLGESISRFFNPYTLERASRPFKVYPGSRQIPLADYSSGYPPNNFFELTTRRRSSRTFQPYSISLNELHKICHYSYGVSGEAPLDMGAEGSIKLRNVPSPGGLYPLEIYVAILHGAVPEGLYHYRPDINALETLREGIDSEEMRRIIMAEPYITLKDASAVVFTTGILERVSIKYQERGYRFMLMEVGFVAQNIGLISEALGLGSCMVGSYLDDEVNQLLGITDGSETIQNIIVLGKKSNT